MRKSYMQGDRFIKHNLRRAAESEDFSDIEFSLNYVATINKNK